MAERIVCDVAIVGAGPAGISAAVAASKSDAKIAIVDENAVIGGQIFRAARRSRHSAVPNLNAQRIRLVMGASVVDIDPTGWLLCESLSGPVEIEFGQLILATGARELFLPFPGWTLPGVFGAGGLQALSKQGMSVRGKDVVVAGSGPLLLAVAKYLRRSGARVRYIFEQAEQAELRKLMLGLWRHPKKLLETFRYYGVARRFRPESWIVRADGKDCLQSITITNGTTSRKIETDYLACGFGLIPNTEPAALAGCRIENGRVWTDKFLRSSCEKIYAPGEATGIGGLDCAQIEGTIAGLAATGNLPEAKEHFESRDKARAFADKLEKAFALRAELKKLADENTIVCRCEDVPFGAIRDRKSFREAKLQTRLGMGPCQGRVCGAACGFLFDWETPSVRPPLLPARVESLIER